MRRKHRRWRHQLAPWRLFEISLPLQHEVQGLCAVLVSSSDQAALGLLRVASAAPASAAAKAAQGSMFEAWPLEHPWSSVDDEDLARAIALSLPTEEGCLNLGLTCSDQTRDEEAQLQAALLASLVVSPSATTEEPKEKKREKKKKETPMACNEEEVANAIAALAQARPSETLSINELNQDANCKKILKPLLKKHQVKLSKLWLSKFPHLLKVYEEGSSIVVRAVLRET